MKPRQYWRGVPGCDCAECRKLDREFPREKAVQLPLPLNKEAGQ